MKEVHRMFWKQILVFNWPAFIAAFLVIVVCMAIFILFPNMPALYKIPVLLVAAGTFWFSAISLIASYFIYDHSDLYKFSWLRKYFSEDQAMLNVYSGYSEGGHILNRTFKHYNIIHLDFFNTDVSITASIKKAQSLSSLAEKRDISYSKWNIGETADIILFMQSLHELRKPEQKKLCIEEAKKHLKLGGKIIIAEHLCNFNNFLIYGPGVFHFFGYRHWKAVFDAAGLTIETEMNMTAFVKIYILST